MRNSKAIQIAQHLLKYEVDLSVVDPWINPAVLPADLRDRLIPLEDVRNMDVLVFAVQHRQFNQLTPEKSDRPLSKNKAPESACRCQRYV